MAIAFGALGGGRLFFDWSSTILLHNLKAYTLHLTLRRRLSLKGLTLMNLCSRELNDVR
jgi:hypothetical protein